MLAGQEYRSRFPMAQATQDARAIKDAVREHYGSRIQGSSCCCGSSADCCATPTEVALYGLDTLASLPADITTAT
jgi:hypothetical protein